MKVIAIKSRSVPSNSLLGYIKPILKFNEDQKAYEKAKSPDDFPNDGEIFVIKGYQFIDNDFEQGELFEIDDIKINETTYDSERPGSCYFTVTNANIVRIEGWKYLPIYDIDIDLQQRSIKNTGDIQNTSPFFISKDGAIFGPFTYDIVSLSALSISYFDNEIFTESNIIEQFLTDNQDFIFKYNLDSIKHILIGDYVSDLELLFDIKPTEVIYFGTKEKIIDWGKRRFTSKFNESERLILDKIKDYDFPDIHSSADKQKIELFAKYLAETNTWINLELPKYFQEYLKSDKGSVYVDKFLEDNKEYFFTEYRKTEIQEKENFIKLKSEQLETLKQAITEIEDRTSQDEDKTFEGIDDEQKAKLKKIIGDENERALLIKYYDSNKDLTQINDEINRAKGQLDYLKDENKSSEKLLETIRKSIKDVKSELFEDSSFAKKVIDAKIYTDLLNNIDPSLKESNSPPVISGSLIINKTEFSTKQFIEEVQLRLDKIGRKIQYNDLVNYLVLLNQNFITVIAGLPGVGKTSLVQKISQSLGLNNNKRFLKIPVARGWTSSKDLIGYYNPLTRKYQSSKTDLYSFLKLCANDSKNELELPSIILLDEANLSPIEHYWSDFIDLSDNDNNRTIRTTDEETIMFGSGVRFLATINYDHTTEVLSDRLLSRAPVIKLNVGDYVIDDILKEETLFDSFSMTQFNQYLSKNSQKEYFKGDIKNKFDSIVKTLQEEETTLGQPLIIGMRKYKSVESYCTVAGNIMEDSNKFTALDYAVNQHILPLINGRGDNYSKRLHELKDKLQGLPQSLKSVNRIIQIGNDNFKNYKYFS